MRIKLGMTKRRSMELKRMEEAGLIASYKGTVVEKMTKTYYCESSFIFITIVILEDQDIGTPVLF